MSSIFEFNDYKHYVNTWLEQQPKGGRGLLSQIAKELGIHTTLLSHTLRGEKHLNSEQGILLAEYMGLSEAETHFLLLLIQRDRAGNTKLQQKYQKDILQIRADSKDVSKRVLTHTQLTETQKAQFYSSWLYSAIRQLSSIPHYQSRAKLGSAFDIKKEEFNTALKFLLETELCVEKDNRIDIGPANTHIEATSPFVFLHHKNWRIKALEKHNNLSADELMYSAPFTISEEDFAYVREELVRFIQSLIKTVGKTKNERLACFNADLFFVK